MNLRTVIKHPILSEKTLLMAGKGVYTLAVDPQATKNQISQALQMYFDVTADSIRTINQKGQTKRVPGKRKTYTTPDKKKAMITLKKGQKLTLFESWFSLEDNK